MNALAGFIMKGRSQAILVTSVLTMISWALSLASLLAAAAVALPTLRRGGREGLFIMLGALPVVALAGQFIMGNALQAGGYSLALWAPVVIVAMVLRESASLSIAVMSALALGLLLVAGFYLVVSEPSAFWYDALERTIKPMLQQGGAELQEGLIEQTLRTFARYATGAIAAGSVMTVLISLLLARWWQACLYNPGGFRVEFVQLRLPAAAAYGFLILLLAAAYSGGMAEFATNLLLPVLMGFLLAGFSVLHALCSRSAAGRFWLAGIYVGLMFIAPLILLIALVGLSDSWFKWRERLTAPG